MNFQGDSVSQNALGLLLAPRSIAVVGASDRPGPGRKVLENLSAVRFSGPVYPVNRHAGMLNGLVAYPSLTALPEVPDLVVVAVNSAGSVAVVEEAARLGCKGGVLLAAGFGEVGSGGAVLGEELTRRSEGLHLIGPNCLGFLNLRDRVAAYSGPLPEPTEAGRLGLISNSGAMACSITGAASERRIGFSHIVTTGNQLDVSVADFVNVLAHDDRVSVVACYLEGFEDGRGLLDSFETAANCGKAVVVLKSGRSRAGGEAAKTHTGVLAGSAVVQSDLFAQSGVMMAADPEEFLALIELTSRLPRPPAATLVGAVTISGGERLLLADGCDEFGVPLASIEEDTAKAVTAALPIYATATNPLDTTGAGIVEGNSSAHEAAVFAIAADPNVGLLLACQDSKNGWQEGARASDLFFDAVTAAHRASVAASIPLVVLSATTGEIDRRARNYLAAAGVPCLVGFRPGMAALSQFLSTSPAAGRLTDTRAALWQDRARGVRLDSATVIQRLARYDIAHWPTRFVATLEDALQAAKDVGYPVVLKIESGLAHRKVLNAVRIGIRGPDALASAWAGLSKVAASRGLSPADMSIQSMVLGGEELFVGGLVDDQFGPLVLFGSGGTDVEDSSDLVVALAPLDAEGAERLVSRAACVSKIRGEPTLRSEVAAVVRAVSEMIAEDGVAAVDINPLLVVQNTTAIVDAKIVVFAS